VAIATAHLVDSEAEAVPHEATHNLKILDERTPPMSP
jgi:hypothetical protein